VPTAGSPVDAPWRRGSRYLACSLPQHHPGAAAMPDEPILREKARAAIQNGKIPARRPDRTWGGPGVGATCAICEKPWTKAELDFEIQFERDGDNPSLDKFHVHIRCFAAWEFERNKARSR
jgi:hypothetical protein